MRRLLCRLRGHRWTLVRRCDASDFYTCTRCAEPGWRL